ncbi:MAG: hypothetical protein K6B40_06975 [Firmicutes bacterium]|nr:hypothetical protein [Bacillota bacterium]
MKEEEDRDKPCAGQSPREAQDKSDWLKEKWQALSGKEKKTLGKLLAVFLLGAALMLFAGGERSQAPSAKAGPPAEETGAAPAGAADFTAELTALLQQVKGAGKVEAILTYAGGPQKVYAYDREERQGEAESSLKTSLSQGEDGPVLLQENDPPVQGVIVVSEGAGDPLVKERLYQAVSSLLALPANRIAIVEGKGGGE